MDISNPQTEELEKLGKEANILIDRVHNEYNKFFGGGEKKPPIQLREMLDKTMAKIIGLQRNITNVSLRFRTQNVIGKYNTHRTMWDKKMAEREGGKAF
jgi:hypothetical protein